MTAYQGEFTLSRLERVVSGPGTIAALGAELDRLHRRRAVVITGKTLGQSALLTRVTDALGDRCVAVVAGARQHVPATTVSALVATLGEQQADCLVSFGGGSPIDTAKVALNAALTAANVAPQAQTDGLPVIHVAVPTTLSASEYTSVAGVTDETTRIKRGVLDPRVTARVVIADADLTAETPDWLWLATGMRAMDHAIESIYAARHHPMTDALGSRAIALFTQHLLPSVRSRGAERIDHRSHCLMASWLSVVGLTHAGFGVSHALGHQLGPRWDIAHGVTSCITLPHAMRLMARLAPERFEPIAAGFKVPFDASRPLVGALDCADRMAALIAESGLPSRLRDARVPREELGGVAARVYDGMMAAGVVDRPVTPHDVEGVLEAAY